MGRAVGKTRIQRGLVNMSDAPVDAPSERWEYTPEDHDEEFQYENVLAEGETLMVRHVFRQGRIVQFNFTQMTRRGGKWHHVARADSCHGTVHLHRFSATGAEVGDPKVLVEVLSQEDLENGYDKAEVVLEDEWSENLRRWRDGR